MENDVQSEINDSITKNNKHRIICENNGIMILMTLEELPTPTGIFKWTVLLPW